MFERIDQMLLFNPSQKGGVNKTRVIPSPLASHHVPSFSAMAYVEGTISASSIFDHTNCPVHSALTSC